MDAGVIVVGTDSVYPITNYRGFDGILWPFSDTECFDENVFLPICRIDEAISFKKSCKDESARILIIGDSVEYKNIINLGYDVGFIENRFSYFSCVLNDIINVNGCCNNLKKHLNANGLFSYAKSARRFIDIRNKIPNSEKENISVDLHIFNIFEYKIGNDE